MTTVHAPILQIAAAPTGEASIATTAITYAARTVRRFIRTPQLIVTEVLISAMFLLMFRYVFGGAISAGSVAYADYLIPAMAASAALFSSGAVGVADDVASGMYDRLRSLPLPRPAILLGRSLADTTLVALSVCITLILGYATGFRFHGTIGQTIAALALLVLFGAVLTWPLIAIGLASGNTQAAQGMSFVVFPFVFVSSAYVPVHTMPGWLQPIAEHQPLSYMIGSVRALVLGQGAVGALGHTAGWFIVRALAWSAVILAVFIPFCARRFARH